MAKFRAVQPKRAVTVWLFKTRQGKETVCFHKFQKKPLCFEAVGPFHLCSSNPASLLTCVFMTRLEKHHGVWPLLLISDFIFKTNAIKTATVVTCVCPLNWWTNQNRNLKTSGFMHGPNTCMLWPAATTRTKGKVQRRSVSWLQTLLFFFLLKTFHVVISCFLWESLHILHKYTSRTCVSVPHFPQNPLISFHLSPAFIRLPYLLRLSPLAAVN